ncbi:MAG: insulinase family protein, partial [Clostridia bacterium]|nr:insulinase family protein [Clostridia bacterium]
SLLNRELARLYGAQLDASAEKTGDHQLLKIGMSVIDDRYTLEKDSLLKKSVNMLLSLIFEPKAENGAFDESDLAREKRKAIEHIKGEISEKRIYAKNRMLEEMYRGQAYGLPKCGTVEEVQAVTGDSLYRAWQNLLRQAYVRIQVIGAAIPAGFWETVTEKFSAIPRRDIHDPHRNNPTKPIKEPRMITETMNIRQGKLVLGFSSDLYGDDDTSLPLMIAADIFGGGPYSRLFSNVREKMSLCYYCSASAVRQKGLVMVDSGVEAENAPRAEKEILSQLAAIQQGEFTDFEFASSVKSLRDSLYSYQDSQNALDAWYALRTASRVLYTPEEVAEKLLTVTREQVQNAAKGIRLNTVYRLLPQTEKEG